LKCKTKDLLPTVMKAIEEEGKEKLVVLEKQTVLDRIKIKTMEKKVQELTKIDELNRNLV
jgi:hypothetical protein